MKIIEENDIDRFRITFKMKWGDYSAQVTGAYIWLGKRGYQKEVKAIRAYVKMHNMGLRRLKRPPKDNKEIASSCLLQKLIPYWEEE